MYLSRLTLKRTPSAEALAALITPEDENRRLDAHHRLIWTAFAGDAEAKRDFLWRDAGDGRFLVLSGREPVAADLFEAPEIKEFAPILQTGDCLQFLLRVNATKTVKTDRVTGSGKREREHRDIVMDSLRAVPTEARSVERQDVAQRAAQAWLAATGLRTGFEVREMSVESYRVLEPPGRKNRLRFGVLDLAGTIAVTDPINLIKTISSGFGRAKAFGCGLMLIRRA